MLTQYLLCEDSTKSKWLGLVISIGRSLYRATIVSDGRPLERSGKVDLLEGLASVD